VENQGKRIPQCFVAWS